MSSLIEGGKKQQNYPVYIQDNWSTVIENVYGDSISNERERPVTVILLLCVYILLKAPLPFTQKKLVAIRKVLK